MEVSGQSHATVALLLQKIPSTLSYRTLGGPRGRSGPTEKILSPPAFEPRTVQSVNECLYRLSHPGRPCHIDKCMCISVHVQIGLHRHMYNLTHNIETGIAFSCVSLTVSRRNAFLSKTWSCWYLSFI
jgi:hypothetical protein